MIAIDTNILLYAHRKETANHITALHLIESYCTGAIPWGIPWICITEFFRVATHPKVYVPPTPLQLALGNLSTLFNSPSFYVFSETERHREILFNLIQKYKIVGNHMFDLKILALCVEHGITELITNDSDFLRFTEIKVVNPFR